MRWGLLGTLLVLSPWQFANYFYDYKDAVFLALSALTVTMVVSFIKQPTWRTVTWHATSGLSDVRVMRILLLAATLALVGLRAVRSEYCGQRTVGPAGLYLALMAGLLVAF